jgi:flagellar biosynthetic protein FlhB
VPEDFGEKTEAPTQKRREEARERGQIAKSHDLTAAIALLGAMIALNFLAPQIFHELMNLTKKSLDLTGSEKLVPDAMYQAVHVALIVLAKAVLPISLVLMVLAVIVSLAQVGFLFTWEPLIPKFSKINPISGFARMFSLDALMKLCINLLKVGIIGYVSYLTIKDRMAQIVNLAALDNWHILGITAELMFLLGIRLAVILLVLAIFDYAYTWFQNEQKLRMSKQELKEEMRRMEGDPLTRERRRRVARQLANQRMRHAVPRADVVITNPTELAIAIKYDVKTMSAPKVVAKGADFLAAKIREIAIENHVPIIERKPLAQTLYKTVEVGQEIPPSLYKAVAEILAYVYELTGKKSSMSSTLSQTPMSQSQMKTIHY